MHLFLRHLTTIFILLLLNSEAKAIGMRCTTVSPNGDVTVTWDRNLTSSANFRCWYLFHSTSAGGPYTAIDSVFFYSDTIQTHVGANAYNNSAYYYIAYKFNNGTADILSDSIKALGLNVNNPGIGYANLAWNATRVPLIATNSIWYKIFREYPAGIFSLIDSVNASTSPNPMTYSDLISICSDTIKYRVEVMDQSGCSSISPLKGDLFKDLVTPAIPMLDSVSVDLAGNAVIGWEVNPSKDTKTYTILQFIGGLYQPIASNLGRNNTLLNSSISAGAGSVTFSVIAIDSCNNPSAASPVNSTIFLTTAFDLCSKSIGLNWNAYSGWPSTPMYDVLVSVNGGTESVIGTTSSTSFTDTNLTSGFTFCYRVRAINQSAIIRTTSTSNRSCLSPSFPPPPAYSYIRSVSVGPENFVTIKAYVDPLSSVSGYRLLRSNSQTGNFVQVNSLTVNSVSTIIFTDNVTTSEGPYYYKIYTIDSCGRKSKESQVSHTVLLNGQAQEGYMNALNWTSYASWPTGVDVYNLYLTVNGITSPLPVASFQPGDSTFIQSVLNNFYSDGKFCYKIMAVENQGNPYFFLDTSFSNEVCIIQQPNIFIPTAFHPGGFLNEIFYPSTAFVSSDNYSFMIFDRWGELFFKTSDPKAGWDGTSHGISAPEAVYIYLLRAQQPDGALIEKKGSVTLIR